MTRSTEGDALSNINWRTGAVIQAHRIERETQNCFITTYTVLDIRTANLARMSIESMVAAVSVALQLQQKAID